MEVTAILLAGGQGSRMNYRHKAWEIYHGRPLISYVLDVVTSVVSDVVISSNEQHEGYNSLPWPTVRDIEPGQGPLAGVMSCLPHVTTPLTLVVPCDVPNLPGNLLELLLKNMGGSNLCVVRDHRRLQSLVFLARTSSLGSIQTYLSEGRRSVRGWLESATYSVAMIPEGVENLRNINDLGQLNDRETRPLN